MGWRALRRGDWKLLWDPYDDDDGWRLYNIKADPNEAFDLSAVRPIEFSQMIDAWKTYAAQNNVVLWRHAPESAATAADADGRGDGQPNDENAPARARRRPPR